MRVAGLTATPYRLDRTSVRRRGRIFSTTVVLRILDRARHPRRRPVAAVVEGDHRDIDVSGVGKRGGEFIAEQLEAAAICGDVVERACDEIASYLRAASRVAGLLRRCRHAELVRDALCARGVDAEMVLGETPDDERDRIIEDFRAGRLTCIVSVMVLSYGFNVPHVDLIALLRPTCSAGFMCSRSVAGPARHRQANCLVLDFAGNVRRFGPVDDARIGQGASKTATRRPRSVRSATRSSRWPQPSARIADTVSPARRSPNLLPGPTRRLF